MRKLKKIVTLILRFILQANYKSLYAYKPTFLPLFLLYQNSRTFLYSKLS